MKRTTASVLTLLLVVVMLFAGFVPAIAHAAESNSALNGADVTVDNSAENDSVQPDKADNELIFTLNPDLESIENMDLTGLKVMFDKVLAYAETAIVASINNEELLDKIWYLAIDAYALGKGYDSLDDALADLDLAGNIVAYARALVITACDEGILAADALSVYEDVAKAKIGDVKDALETTFGEKLDNDAQIWIGAYAKEIEAELDKSQLTAENLNGFLTRLGVTLTDDEIKAFIENAIADPDNALAEITAIIKENGFALDLAALVIIPSVQYVNVNGINLYSASSDNGGQLDLEGIALLVASLPGLNDLANVSNDDMKLSANVEIVTDYGISAFAVTAKIGSNHEYIRAVAALLSKYVNLDFANGGVVVDITVPKELSKAIVDAAVAGAIDPVLKAKVFNSFSTNGSEIYTLINSLSLSDLVALLGYVDFESLIDDKLIKHFVDLSAYEGEEAANAIGEYRKYFVTALNSVLNVAKNLVNNIPGGTVDLVGAANTDDNFSYSNGTVAYNGTHVITKQHVEQLLNKGAELTGISKDVVDTLMTILPESFNNNGSAVNVDFSANFENVKRIDYVVDNEIVKSGWLAVGASISEFGWDAGMPYWVDETGAPVTTMPDTDTVVYAIFGGETPIYVSDLIWNWPEDPNSIENEWVPVYNGGVFTAFLTCDNFDINMFDLVLEGHEGSDAGNYVARIVSAALKSEFKDEYALVGNFADSTFDWRIDPKGIDISHLQWTGSDHYYFDGQYHTVELLSLPMYAIPYYEECTALHAGEYTASVTFGSSNPNYVFLGSVDNFNWSISPIPFDVSTLVWTDADFMYNGCLQGVYLTNLPTDFIDVVYTDNESTEAGNYTAVATLSSIDYILSETELYNEWSISAVKLIASDIVWDYLEGSLIYNGNPQGVLVTDWNLNVSAPEFESQLDQIKETIKLVYTGNSEIDASNDYVASVTFVLDNGNFTVEIADGESDTCAWKILPEVIVVPELTWGDTEFVYNGSVHGVAILDVIANATIVYGGQNSATDAGAYTATATVVPVNGNYVVTGNTEYSITWTVAKAALDDSGIKFENQTFVYDGLKHSLAVSGDEALMSMLNIVYEGNDKSLVGGPYTVTATITLKDQYAGNYESYKKTITATITITGDKKSEHHIKDQDGNIIVDVGSSTPLTPDYIINGGVNAEVEQSYEIDGKDAEVLGAYDIYFVYDGKEANFAGSGINFTVRLLIPEKYRSLDADELQVIHIKDNGDIEVMDAERDGDYMVFTTTHFSTYAIVRVEESSLLWLWILLAILLLVIIAVVVFFILRNKNKDNAPAPDAIPVVEETPAEEPAPAPVEEIIVEEEPEAEEEIPEVDEEPVVEAIEEPVVEEPVIEETVIEEPIPEEPIPEEPQTAILVMGEDGKEATAIIGGQVVHIRFRSSFMSRLIQSAENIQDFYSTIKNHILSYKGIKVRSSWNYEAFNKGRNQLVKLNIKGKTLIVNLNLDPKEFNINKYHFIDCSEKPKFAKVPMMMKVRSARSLKYTLELIDEMMRKYEIAQGELPTVDYKLPYETTEALAKRGLVKVILPAGVTLSEDMTFVQVDISELIESGATLKTTEQIIAGDVNLTDEASEVETTPVVEEAPAEEHHFVPVIEILSDGTVHADAALADQLISDEEAEAKIEIISVEPSKREGKLGEINLDVICDNFDDDDVVDVDALKEKRLIPSKIGRIKVLARGIMYKRLEIRASKFSLQAVKMINLAGGKAELEEDVTSDN